MYQITSLKFESASRKDVRRSKYREKRRVCLKKIINYGSDNESKQTSSPIKVIEAKEISEKLGVKQ
ncbi:MAG: hypothetical protein WCB90_08425 [Methanosarcina sp.]